MKRAAIYARYSSDRQKPTSLDDQIAMAQRFCAEQGWTVVEIFTDKERTGKNTRRPGFQAMKAAVEAGRVDVVVIEAIDRLTRKIADALNHFDLFRFQDTELYSVVEGKQDFFRVLLAGLGAQLYGEMVGQHSKRAIKGGLDRQRLHTSAYGYRSLAVPTGLNREIDAEEAAIVLRIFTEFAEGKSAQTIAAGLNAERIPSPNGGTWEPTTIRGHAARGEGILHNRLYIGIARVCATTRSYHPETGAKRTVMTPGEQVEAEFPELRISPQALWDKVREQLAHRSTQRKEADNPGASRRSRYLFSGLMICGCCGAPFVKHSTTSFKCREARKGACRNGVSMPRKQIEARVFARLHNTFLSPDFTARFEAAVEAERTRLGASDIDGEMARLRAARTEAQSAMDSVMAAIEQGAPYARFRQRVDQLEAELAEIEANLARAEARKAARNAPKVNIAAVYANAVAKMETLLGDPDLVEQAHGYLRTLIHRIVLVPDPAAEHGMAATIETDFVSPPP